MKRAGLFLAVGLLAAPAPAADAVEPDERGLWAVWTQQRDAPDDHAACVAACDAFETQSPDDPYGVVTRGIAAWHLLKQHRLGEAAERLSSLLEAGQTPLEQAAADIARAWLTRLDREQVRVGLKMLYSDALAFPASLDALRSLPQRYRPPPTDRWGTPWEYRLIGFKMIAGFHDQKYLLQSRRLGPRSDLEEVLKTPYLSGVRLKPVRLSAGAGTTVVHFDAGPKDEGEGQSSGTVVMSVGSRSGQVVFAALGPRLIILATDDHWSVLARPR